MTTSLSLKARVAISLMIALGILATSAIYTTQFSSKVFAEERCSCCGNGGLECG